MNNDAHPLSSIMHSHSGDSRTRAASAGVLQPVSPKVASVSVVVANMVKSWNFSAELRDAKTKNKAKKVIKRLIRVIPY